MAKSRISFINVAISFLLALVVTISILPAVVVSARAESINGGLGATCYNQLTVWTTPNKSAVRGYVYAHESFTILSKSGNAYHIQYSSSSGTKDGYLVGETINDYTLNTCVASAKSNTTVYYGPNISSYDKAGTVYSGEYVVVLGTDPIIGGRQMIFQFIALVEITMLMYRVLPIEPFMLLRLASQAKLAV